MYWGPHARDAESSETPAPHQGFGFEIVAAGAGAKKAAGEKLQLVAIPLLNVATSLLPEEKEDGTSLLQTAAVESVIAAPKQWCPNPAQTSCMRVHGDSMCPVICDGYIVAVDSSQTDHAVLNGKIVIAWTKDKGLSISRFRRYDRTEVLQPENQSFESITLNKTHQWRVLGKVLSSDCATCCSLSYGTYRDLESGQFARLTRKGIGYIRVSFRSGAGPQDDLAIRPHGRALSNQFERRESRDRENPDALFRVP